MARRFLWVVAGLTILVIAGAIAYRIFQMDLMKATMVPTIAFEEEAAPPEGPTYADAAMWIARPDIADNPALWLPEGFGPADSEPQGDAPEPSAEPAAPPTPPKASVFFVHPTSYLERSHWNAPLDHPDSQQRAALFVRSQASAFNGIGAIWAPKYRQATFGAFLTSHEDAQKALAFAYRDVLAAFEAFLKEAPADRPIILAAHSQGSLHLTRLLRERIAGRPEAKRIAAAYVIGWPVSVTADLKTLGLPACETSDQAGCIVAFQSFAEPADPKMVTDVYDASVAPDGTPRVGSPMLCVNPLTGAAGGAAGPERNLGTLVPNGDLTQAKLVKAAVPARCDVRGFLLIGEDDPELGPYVLPGNNYHVYDYALFWANLRADAEARLTKFHQS
ncbi:DUF3089 domain-containing protein [Sphingomonas sp. LY54]|uniref:DUF3089 domain-containing protein n=1 Tax=Sphingomonas sp. LY54 TaxID=3095343 RepID=UPI002D79564B|nr:DUF3089 domain-containing protein [Sphingomonas sp. LY54]WRP30167.1 DUF3089 domain-containing protein [Sphingomonas sp. LY54]